MRILPLLWMVACVFPITQEELQARLDVDRGRLHWLLGVSAHALQLTASPEKPCCCCWLVLVLMLTLQLRCCVHAELGRSRGRNSS